MVTSPYLIGNSTYDVWTGKKYYGLRSACQERQLKLPSLPSLVVLLLYLCCSCRLFCQVATILYFNYSTRNIFHLKIITFAIKKLQKEKTLSCPIQDSEDCMSIIELLVLYNCLHKTQHATHT